MVETFIEDMITRISKLRQLIKSLLKLSHNFLFLKVRPKETLQLTSVILTQLMEV